MLLDSKVFKRSNDFTASIQEMLKTDPCVSYKHPVPISKIIEYSRLSNVANDRTPLTEYSLSLPQGHDSNIYVRVWCRIWTNKGLKTPTSNTESRNKNELQKLQLTSSMYDYGAAAGLPVRCSGEIKSPVQLYE
ncbi:hypothetical protein MSG28_000161, partial [Choristoneura fumiferana]